MAKMDFVLMTIINNYLHTTAEEMGIAMRNTALSPVFNEALDFSCAVFDEKGDILAQGEHCPAQLGALPVVTKYLIEEFGLESFGPNDVYLHNDPYTGMNHLPEHCVTKAVYYKEHRIAMLASIGHMAETGGLAPGGFPGNASEVFHEGTRIPPVKFIKEGKRDEDLWRLILANVRTPKLIEGDLLALVGSLYVGEKRMIQLIEKYGIETYTEVKEELKRYAETRMRKNIQEIPDGTYEAEDFIIDNDGWVDEPAKMKVRISVEDDEITVDFTGSDKQRKGPVNLTVTATISAVYNAILHLTDPTIPTNIGRYRPIHVVAPKGTIVNPYFPAATVGGNSETHPQTISLIWRALASALPAKVAAAGGGTAMLITFGGLHPETKEIYTHIIIEGMGWGGKEGKDGWDVVTVPNSNCAVTPIETYEIRYPVKNLFFGLHVNSGGAGKYRGGLGSIRVMEVTGPEVVFSCYHEREKLNAWGLFGGKSGSNACFLVKKVGNEDFRTFKEAFGVSCASKFTNITLQKGDLIKIVSPGGGGFGDPCERELGKIIEDVKEGYCTVEYVRANYPSFNNVDFNCQVLSHKILP